MWPFESKHRKAVVVFHIDHNGLAKGAYFRGEADVLIIDERDPKNRVYRMGQETPDDELRRKIGKHPLGAPARGQRDRRAEPGACAEPALGRGSDPDPLGRRQFQQLIATKSFSALALAAGAFALGRTRVRFHAHGDFAREHFSRSGDVARPGSVTRRSVRLMRPSPGTSVELCGIDAVDAVIGAARLAAEDDDVA